MFPRTYQQLKQASRHLGAILHRNRQQSIGDRSLANQLKLATYSLSFTFFFFSLIYLFTGGLGKLNLIMTGVPFVPDRWQIWAEPPTENCESSADKTRNCLARLWQSKNFRGAVQPGSNSPFWIGYKLSREELQEAQQKSANYVVLGWIRGDYSISVNGERITSGKRADPEPVVFPIPPSWLSNPNGISIAIRVEPQLGIENPAAFAKPFKEQLTTAAEATAYLTSVGFYKKSRPFALLMFNLAISLLFFFIWHSDKEVREAFYLASYTLISAAMQMRISSLQHGQLSPMIDYSLGFILRFYEGGLGLLLGLSFARARKELMGIVAAITVFTPWLILPLAESTLSLRGFSSFLDKNLLPICYMAGGLVCFLKWQRLKNSTESLKSRRQNLLVFSLGLTTMAVLYQLEKRVDSFFTQAFLWKIGHIGVIVPMVIVTFRDYREQKRLFKKSPISKYHRQNNLPTNIQGVILTLDLKKSEELFQFGLSIGNSGHFTALCLGRIWTEINRQNGTVLSSDGDAIKALFAREDCPMPMVSALNAIEKISSGLQQVSEEVRATQLELEPNWQIHFRAGLAEGEIKPDWLEDGQNRFPTWVESASSQPFLHSARMMDLERQLQFEKESVAIFSADVAAELLKKNLLKRELSAHSIFLKGKHGKEYCVSAYSTSGKAGRASESSTEKKSLAA